MRKAIWWVIGAIALCSEASAQAPSAPDMRWFEGRWQGTGASFGQPGEASLDVHPVLDGKFMELNYKVAIGGQRPMTFEGRAFYRMSAPGRMEAHWFDNRGVTFPISATLSPTSLTADWRSPNKEQGRNVYRLREDRKLEVVDTVKGKDGDQREFARYVYVRIL